MIQGFVKGRVMMQGVSSPGGYMNARYRGTEYLFQATVQGCLLGAPMEGVAGLEALWKLERRKAWRPTTAHILGISPTDS